MNVPLYVPWLTNSDKKAVLSSLKNPQLTDGPLLRKFELEFAKYVGSRFAIGVSNGTSALHLSLLSIGIRSGDEVIIPDMTFIATANAVTLSNAKPICADVDSSLNISVKSIENKITKKTKAIIPVHFAGISCKMDEIAKIARKHNLKIIEDCAHSFGAFCNNKHVGTFGDAGCFSFYPTKNITTIEGGMIITNSEKIAKKVASLRNHGMTRTLIERQRRSNPWLYDVVNPGYNYRLDEVRSALGLSQLKRCKEITTRRKQAAKYYNKKLIHVKGIEPVNYQDEKNHVYHLYIIRIKKEFGFSRDIVHKRLYDKGIRTTVHYKPIHRFSYFNKLKLRDKKFPNTMLAYKECLSLPIFPTITRKQQDYVIKCLLELQKIK
jgi:perosamine synthetase